ncbi:hypothetical protein NHJ13051_004243 [Beauveria bassiana]
MAWLTGSVDPADWTTDRFADCLLHASVPPACVAAGEGCVLEYLFTDGHDPW